MTEQLALDGLGLPVPAAHAWRDNAELVADVARLGYLRVSDVVLDPTYGLVPLVASLPRGATMTA